MKLANDTMKYIDNLKDFKLVPVSDNNDLLQCLYNEILLSSQYYNKIKKEIDIDNKRINSISKIPFPKTRSKFFFPEFVQNLIQKNSNMFYIINLNILGIKFNIYIVYEIENFNISKYVEFITTWLHIVLTHKTLECSKNVNVYIYLTDFNKILPDSETDILGPLNINSAFTSCCTRNTNEIIVFRKQEWLKVFMHESIHAFGLDFCRIDDESISNKIKKIFPVDSDIYLNEAYTESWAEIFNLLFTVYYIIPKKDINIGAFIDISKQMISYEKTYSIFQMIKILDFMNLKYTDLYEKNKISTFKRESFFKENTNVFSYYVIKCIIMFNLEEFIFWCNDNNLVLLDFYKSKPNVDRFIDFIKKKFRNKHFLKIINKNQEIFNILKKNNNFFKNTRMSLLEMSN